MLRDRISGVAGPGPASEEPVDSDGHDAAIDPDPDESTRAVKFQADGPDLFRYGMTSNQVWILMALAGAPASNWVESRLSGWFERLDSSGLLDTEMLTSAPLLIALLVGVFIVSVALLIMVVSGLLAIIRFHGYQLLLDADRFKARFGLLDVRERTLKVAKLHSIEMVQTAVGRLLGQWHAIGHQTGAAQPGREFGDDRRFLVPGIDAQRLESVVTALRAEPWRAPEWNAIHSRFRSMLSMRISLVMISTSLGTWLLLPGKPVWPGVVILCVNLLVLGSVHLHWRRWGYALDGQRVRIRSGLVGQRILEFDLGRCQQVKLNTSPYQRRHGLASLTIRLPHGEQDIPYLPRPIADRIVNLVLYRVESARTHGL